MKPAADLGKHTKLLSKITYTSYFITAKIYLKNTMNKKYEQLARKNVVNKHKYRMTTI